MGMLKRTLGRCAGLTMFAAALVGCASDSQGSSGLRSLLPGFLGGSSDNDCVSNRKACLYEGAYEPGERQYAEDEARRLNQAELARLRRASIR